MLGSGKRTPSPLKNMTSSWTIRTVHVTFAGVSQRTESLYILTMNMVDMLGDYFVVTAILGWWEGSKIMIGHSVLPIIYEIPLQPLPLENKC